MALQGDQISKIDKNEHLNITTDKEISEFNVAIKKEGYSSVK